ncbi:MAG TPA: FAD-dependent oxidoreductase [Acidobacteriaceae bacterium]|jgi:glycine/D-amino acid oxidase-like deaminating enzyme|nr:FAD-dependent oxidoreductase [Acidobacteriaceae bacterium]
MGLSYDVVILGAGIVGAACALEFVQAGMRVAVIERGVIGGDATAAGMGHIVVMDDSAAQFALTRYSQLLWAELAPGMPENVEYDRCGTLWIARDEEEMREVQRKYTYYQSLHVPVEILDSSALAHAEPNLSTSLAGALLVPEDAVLYPPAAALFLIRRAQQLGAELYLEKTVDRAGQNTVLLHDATVLHTQRIVNATGASANLLTPGQPIRKRKGHLVITDRYPGFFRHQMIELGYLKSAHSVTRDSVAFNLQPRRTGQLLLGSSRQFDIESTSVDAPIVDAMIERAQQYVPALGTLSALRIWTGFRAATPDKLPLIGPVQQDASMFLAAGHEGLGITTSLATARLLLDQFLERTPAIPMEPYLPSRFAMGVAHA